MPEVALVPFLLRTDLVKPLGNEVQAQGVENFLSVASLLDRDFVLAFEDLDWLPGGPSKAPGCVIDIGLVVEG